MPNPISNSDDIIDSRDVIARIEELEEMREEESDDWTDDDEIELAELRDLAERGEICTDWVHGATLIRDSYFETYAEQLAEDIGAIGRDMPWPLDYIDWEAAAAALQQDYTSVEYGGETYWVR